MASLQPLRIGGHTYWRIVESRRVNGKPRPVPVLYLGRADEVLARFQEKPELRVHSVSHGAVAALWALASELDVAGTIDRHMAASGRRVQRGSREIVGLPPRVLEGLTVGQSLLLIAIGRACHPTSKRGFADWAKETSLGEAVNVDVQKLDSQHFWDQMDQLPLANIAAIEQEIVSAAIKRFDLNLDTLLYDGTNFFTFIASTNLKAKLPARGHNKQKRNDLRQISIALLCTREHGVPLWHHTYEGQVSDARCFEQVLPLIKGRLKSFNASLENMTIVFDKGNVSKKNQQRVDELKLHYVTGMTVAGQKQLVRTANQNMSPVVLDDEETVRAYRTERRIWGKKRTAVVLISETLREGQIRGILQHVSKATKWLADLAGTLKRGKQKRDRATLERDIQRRLAGRQYLSHVLKYQLEGQDPNLTLTFQFEQEALDRLANETLGRLVLITDRKSWTTAEIISGYRSQANIEALFAHLKDTLFIALRPQFHWTDHKLHIHVFTCVQSHLLARLLLLQAQRAQMPFRSQEALLAALTKVRKATVLHRYGSTKKFHVNEILEDVDPSLLPHLATLGIPHIS